MDAFEQMRTGLGGAMTGTGTPLEDADRLCHACVQLLGVDGAAVSLLHEGVTRGTFGSSGALSRRLDELQFTFGEGPCLDAVEQGGPVLVDQLGSPSEHRWPALTEAVLGCGVAAVFALPVALSSSHIGALELFRLRAGPLSAVSLAGALRAAKLAALPLVDLITGVARTGEQPVDDRNQLAGLERVEVHQATGLIMDRLGVNPAHALARLRAHAYSSGTTAGEAARAIIGRTLVLTDDAAPRGDTTIGHDR